MNINTFDDYLNEPCALHFDQMKRFHQEMIDEIGMDPKAVELYDDLVSEAGKYAAIRASWQQMSREEKMEKDSRRTSCHNSVITHLNMLARYLKQQDHAQWLEKIEAYKEKYPLKYHPDVLTGPFIIEEIYRQTHGDALIVTEVGQNQMWAAQYYKFTKPRTLLTSGGLGTMGYGLGASIGAKTARPEKTVVNIAGDGCFRMNMNEIATAARYQIPVIQVVLNNHVLGMVRQWQDLFYGKRYSATVLNDSVDFVKLAEAMGAAGMRATTPEEFREAFAKALTADGPVVIDCQIDSDEKVWPMVAPGEAISKAFDEEDLEAGKKQ